MSRRIDALRAMADQDVSPNERDIARAKLQAAGIPPTPPRPPARAAAPAPEPNRQTHWAVVHMGWGNVASSTTNVYFDFTATAGTSRQ